MSPPVPASPFREVTTSGTTIDSHILSSGCEIGTGIYSIHHSSVYFKDPHVFKPERWLVSEEELKEIHLAYNPFSVGSRQCIGKGVAILELMTVLATIISRFDFRLKGSLGEGKSGAEWGRDREEEFQMYDHVIAAKNGPVLQFRQLNASD